MKPSKPIRLAAFSLTTLALLSGCQTGFLKKPDLGRLAFWKNNDIRLASKRDDIPPPSAHFSPDDGLAKSGKSDLKSSIDEIISEAKRNQQAKSDPDKEPIRTPYSLDTIDPKLSLNHSDSTEKALSDRLQQFESTANKAIKSTQDIVTQTGNAVENTANMFAGWKNSFKDNSENQIKNVAEQLKNQASQTASNTADSLTNFANNTRATVNQTVDAVRNNLDNSFQPAGSALVSNPFAASNAPPDANKSMPGNSNDFNPNFQPSTPTTERIASTSNGQFSLPNSQVQQSSFDGSTSAKTDRGPASTNSTAAILQPVTSVSTSSSGASQYPSTSFGAIQPINKSSSSEAGFQIPPHLLRGEGSFSPGSTTPLRPIQEK